MTLIGDTGTSNWECRLADGAVVTIRHIGRNDIEAVLLFREHLTAEIRQHPFFDGHCDLTPGRARFFCIVKGTDRLALVASHGGVIVGLAQIERTTSPTTADVALFVANAFQKRGVGRRLAQRLASVARQHGIKQLVTTTLSPTTATMLRLLPEFGPVTTTSDGGLATLRFTIPPEPWDARRSGTA